MFGVSAEATPNKIQKQKAEYQIFKTDYDRYENGVIRWIIS